MDEPKKFHDVARPGSTPPQHTSRPIIVGREPIMRDPMMKEEAVPEKPALPDHKDEPKIAPATIAASPAPAPTTVTDPATPPPSEMSTALNSSIPSDAEKEVNSQKNKELEDRNSKVEGLIESKTYAVPVGHLQRKRTLRIVLIVVGVTLVLGSIVAYFIASSM